MLKKPYQKLHTIGNNNYYMIPMDGQMMYSVETFLHTKNWLGQVKELTVGLMQLPVNTIVVKLLLALMCIEEIEQDNPEDKPIEPRFPKLKVNEVREDLKKLYGLLETQNRFKITGSVQNDAIRELVKEGYVIVAVEDIGSQARQVWLAKGNEFGILHISTVLVTGKPSADIVNVMKTFVFNKELAEKIIKKLEGE